LKVIKKMIWQRKWIYCIYIFVLSRSLSFIFLALFLLFFVNILYQPKNIMFSYATLGFFRARSGPFNFLWNGPGRARLEVFLYGPGRADYIFLIIFRAGLGLQTNYIISFGSGRAEPFSFCRSLVTLQKMC
jgi:hypothetical protein